MSRMKDAAFGIKIIDRGASATPRVVVLEDGDWVDEYDTLEAACSDWPSGLVVDQPGMRLLPAVEIPGTPLVGGTR
jgi:hypothetical protein